MTKQPQMTAEEIKERISFLRDSLIGKKNKRMSNGVSIIITVISDLFGGLLVGAGIGYLLYRFFNVHHLIFAIFILLGGIAGLLNVYKSIYRFEKDN